MKVQFSLFTKKPNSTKIPESFDMELDGALAEACSIHAPDITFALPAVAVPIYNYCYIPAFKRYYFVQDWIWGNGLWDCSLVIDILASYRSDINSANLYLLRSSTDWNNRIIDTMYPALTRRVNDANALPTVWAKSYSAGVYVVGIVNDDGYGVGPTTYYALTPTQFKALVKYLFSGVDYLNINVSELSENLQKVVLNPFQYIISAVWFPMTIDGGGTQVSSIPVGWWDIPVSGWTMGTYHTEKEFDIGIPKHPQAATRGIWLNGSPYSTYSLEFWPFGSMPLDASKLYDCDRLNCKYVVDHVTGVGTLRVRGKLGDAIQGEGCIAVAQAQVGVPIQLAQLSMDWSNMTAGAAVAAVAAGVTATSGVIDGINNAVSEIREKISNFGKPTNNQKALLDSWMSKNHPEYMQGREHGGTSGSFDRVEKSISIEKVLSNVGNAISSVMADLSISGSMGGSAVYTRNVIVNGHFSYIADEDNAHFGRPLCEFRRMSEMRNGFYKAMSGDLTITGTSEEQHLLKSYLEGGFYLEN